MAKPVPTPVDVDSPEPRWPAALAFLAVGGLYLALPEPLTLGPSWLLLCLLGLLLVPKMATHRRGQHQVSHTIGLVLSALITFALMWSVGALILNLQEYHHRALELLRTASALWISNILVFAAWYWRLDAGGPHAREKRGAHVEGAFLFPQMTMQAGKLWRPGFVDYLFLAFNTSTAFSPTDAPPLTPWAKLLMMAQSLISLSTLAILAARAVNMF
jgi:hypothetical protein